ncbi:hypothetical protein BS17DRAFT_766489 [Gyrodon lividus]|nr:hypothetical protein BS17DRAFT_766489 [Gyrodon lividus]
MAQKKRVEPPHKDYDDNSSSDDSSRISSSESWTIASTKKQSKKQRKKLKKQRDPKLWVMLDSEITVDNVINIALLLEQEEQPRVTTRLASILTKLSPGSKNVIGDPKKVNELMTITGKMTRMIKTTCSNNVSRLGGKIAVYATPDPSKEAITPPIATGNGGRSHLGLNHPILTHFITPIDSLKLYDEDPVS